MTKKFGVVLPDGINGADLEVIEDLFEMAVATIQSNELYHGFTTKLERSPLGQWRFSIEGL